MSVLRIIAILLACATATTASAECVGPFAERSLLRSADVIFIGTLTSGDTFEHTFSVEETFRGPRVTTLRVYNLVYEGFSGFAGVGRPYLVFARQQTLDGRNEVMLEDCGRNMTPLEDARALVQQLRREQHGQRVSSVYGMLWRSMYQDVGVWDPSYEQPLAGVTLRFKAGRRTYSAVTDAAGAYAIDGMQPGTYSVEAELSGGLAIGGTILPELRPAAVERGLGLEYNVTAVPTTRISGHVRGPGGQPLDDIAVWLFRAGAYRENARGTMGFQSPGKPFSFTRVPPGDYLLVFGNAPGGAPLDPRHPYPRTFYPGVQSVDQATVIHVAPGQQLDDVDIQLPAPYDMRPLSFTIDVTAGSRIGREVLSLVIEGNGWRVDERGRSRAEMRTVWVPRSERYRVRGVASCEDPVTRQRGLITTNEVGVDPGDAPDAPVHLTLTPGECRPFDVGR